MGFESSGAECEKGAKFWHTNGRKWPEKLHKHLISNHTIADSSIENFKIEWETYYEKGAVTINERTVEAKITTINERTVEAKTTLHTILNNLNCKLCSYVGKEKNESFGIGSNPLIRRNTLLRHYCFHHFREPLEYFLSEYFNDKTCLKCSKEYKKSTAEKIIHIGYDHDELLTFILESPTSFKELTNKPSTINEMNLKKKTVKEMYTCEECGKTLSKANRAAHHKLHTSERPYSCEKCPVTFKHSKSLIIHERVHTGYKPYVCDTCAKAFSHEGNYKKHLITQHSAKISVCDECGKTCNSKYDLTVHVEEHYKTRAFSCGHCIKGFHEKRDLERHELIHKGEKLFTCMSCKKRFLDKKSLRRHMKSQHKKAGEDLVQSTDKSNLNKKKA